MSDRIHILIPSSGGKPEIILDGDIISESGNVRPYVLETPKREAADDLYEALKEALHTMEHAYNGNPNFAVLTKSRMRDVLARAEGKDHE